MQVKKQQSEPNMEQQNGFKLGKEYVKAAYCHPAYLTQVQSCCLVIKSCPTLLRPHGLYPTWVFCPWDFPGKNTGVSCHFLLQGVFQLRDQTCISFTGRWILYHCVPRSPNSYFNCNLKFMSLPFTQGTPSYFMTFEYVNSSLLLLLSRFSYVQLCATPETAAHQAPRSLGFSRQECWSGLPFPSPMHESESESEVAQSCPTLSDPMDCSLPGFSIHGIF